MTAAGIFHLFSAAAIEDKAALFDVLAEALTNRWADGKWSWWPRSPCGGPLRETREEAVADLIAWAKKIAEKHRRKFKT